ncbi:hypothetical protein BFJ63_vAg3979 [Fusarium oxysporum f. sp. narcissi]|uniref:Uncharacterized protein n=3 Tax=Fusarium oxysporum TaxID=5507 RepID=A0A420MUZ3_FUSOX|nr:hypothetical protein FOMA001_g11099 [Fusarium oxysporum f. sp. matthiolae]RKK14461.1 hypothetical protein BFJ65_g11022 [Fusarium oxysporum f. sp. cepae]RKK71840.1 hypothetical protein BFJ69_g10586 [Fusarium oxysporum]RYC93114.1 hypothetical protein BFJ63_vAg3979 [Fusarium oxysporum f. sp. narcissi]RKK57827.1 hypothetical protein BFJ67_g3250 [Fusarium oxysporum f. sp. cepae]
MQIGLILWAIINTPTLLFILFLIDTLSAQLNQPLNVADTFKQGSMTPFNATGDPALETS